MGMGLPVLHGVAGESAEIVLREQVGDVFESENAMQLVAGLQRMRDEPIAYANFRQNGLAAAQFYDRKKLALQMLQVFKGMLKG